MVSKAATAATPRVRFYTVKQVCEAVGCKTQFVYDHLADGSMPAPIVRRVRFTRFLANDIDEWMLAGCPNWRDYKKQRD